MKWLHVCDEMEVDHLADKAFENYLAAPNVKVNLSEIRAKLKQAKELIIVDKMRSSSDDPDGGAGNLLLQWLSFKLC